MDEVISLRRDIHRHPELAGDEGATARRLATFFSPLKPDATVEGIGGHGIAFAFGDATTGPTILLRCELDALPIAETNDFEWRSVTPHRSHKCGHDGHMAILAATGRAFAHSRPDRGRVVLLYQPAEETGEGAAAVVADRRFEPLRPDVAFALHNLPGVPFGRVVVREGTFCCASRGMIARLTGSTAHAAQPETGVSPASAMCKIVDELNHLPRRLDLEAELAFATVVGARLGERAFGTAPADATVFATLRSETDETMADMVRHCEAFVAEQACRDGLKHGIDYDDVFPATVNGAAAVAAIAHAARDDLEEARQPFRWSEDFGHFTARCEGAMFGLGAGETGPALHNADYDFPDELIEVGAGLMERIARTWLAAAG